MVAPRAAFFVVCGFAHAYFKNKEETDMDETNINEILTNLYNRCQSVRLRNYIHPKLEAFDLLLSFRSVCNQLDSIIKDLALYLPFDNSVFVDYVAWYNCFSNIETLNRSDFYSYPSSNPKYIIDFIFHGSLIDENRESADEIRRAIDILTSDVYMKAENLERALFYAKSDLLNKLLMLRNEVNRKRNSQEFNIRMVNNWFDRYTCYDQEGNEYGTFLDDYEEWKYNCDDLNNEILETHLWTLLYNLISTNFLVFDKGLYVKHKADDFFSETHFDLVDEVTIEEEELKKKYYVFRRLINYENGKFVLKNKEFLGKYLLKNKGRIKIDDFLEFKYFLDSISLIYADMTFDEVEEEEILSEQDSIILKEIIALVNRGDWKSPATTENVELFFRTLFGCEKSKLDKEDVEEATKFVSFFKIGRTGENSRVNISFANMVGYFIKNGMLDNSPKIVNNQFFNDEDLVNNINKGKNDEGSALFKSLIPLLDKYRKRIIEGL